MSVPASFGTDVRQPLDERTIVDGWFDAIVPRGSAIGETHVRAWVMSDPTALKMTIRIFQGEARLAPDNLLIGELILPLPQGDARNRPVDVRFTYRADGLLEVEAQVRGQDEVHRTVATPDAAAIAAAGEPELPADGAYDPQRFVIANLLNLASADRRRWLEEGIERFGWDKVGADLSRFGEARPWAERLLIERAVWIGMRAGLRAKVETALIVARARDPRDRQEVLAQWPALLFMRMEYPVWTGLFVDDERLQAWQAAMAAVPAWRRGWHRWKNAVWGTAALLVLLALVASGIGAAWRADPARTMRGLADHGLTGLIAVLVLLCGGAAWWRRRRGGG